MKNENGFQLGGRDIDVKAKAVHARGGFRYLQPTGDEPWLGILAGISTDDGSQAWRYFPENLMGKALVDYLSGAIQGGEADNATLVYGGNPHLFPISITKVSLKCWCRCAMRRLPFNPTGRR